MTPQKPLVIHKLGGVALAFIFVVGGAFAGTDPVMTNQGEEEMVQAFAFVKGQEQLAQKLAKEYPEIADVLSQSMLKFEASFKPALTNLDRILLQKNDQWAETRLAIVKTSESNVLSTKVSFDQAQGFVQTLRNRATGREMPSPIYENLLLCHPSYIKQPAEEMLRGYKASFSSKGKEKAREIAMRLEYPASWKAIEGERPNMLQRFVSQNGRGSEMVLLQIKPLPADALAQLSKPEQKEELFSQESMKDFLTDGARFIRSDRIKLDGLSGASLEFSLLQQRLTEKFKMRGLYYYVLYKNCLVGVCCSVNLPETSTDEEVEARLKKFAPVFKLVASSVIFDTQWQIPQ